MLHRLGQPLAGQ